MVSTADFRKLALALPGVEEKSHFGKPDFRVDGKIFAGLSVDGTSGNLKMQPELQAMALAARPKAFSPAAGAWGSAGWTLIELAHVRHGELENVLLEAWRLIAPARRVAAYDASAPSADAQTSRAANAAARATNAASSPPRSKARPSKPKTFAPRRAKPALPSNPTASTSTASPAKPSKRTLPSNPKKAKRAAPKV
jgi:hypothetical protein